MALNNCTIDSSSVVVTPSQALGSGVANQVLTIKPNQGFRVAAADFTNNTGSLVSGPIQSITLSDSGVAYADGNNVLVTVDLKDKFYALFDTDNFIVAPTPSSSFAVELHYYYRPASLTTDDSGTTWISTNAPDALLYASLVEAYTFMKGEADLIQLYQARYAEALSRLKTYAEGRNYSDSYRDGLVRVPKT